MSPIRLRHDKLLYIIIQLLYGTRMEHGTLKQLLTVLVLFWQNSIGGIVFMKSSTSKSSVVTQISLAAVAIVLSYLLLFVASIQVSTVCQILCGGLIAVGIISIVSYFLAGDFKRIDRYGFAVGTMLVLMGIIGLIRLDNLIANFEIYTGLMSLVLGVLVLQGTVQQKVLDYPVWILTLILTVNCIAGALCVLLELTIVTNRLAGFSNWILLVCGGCCLFSMLITWICILLAAKRDKKAAESAESESEPAQEPAFEVPPETTGQTAPAPAPAPAPMNDGPAETHHTGFDSGQDVQSDFPPLESPDLVFGDDVSHHSSSDPDSGQ